MSDRSEWLAEVIAEHLYEYPDAWCACGHLMAQPWEEWPRHVAAAVLDALGDDTAQATVERVEFTEEQLAARAKDPVMAALVDQDKSDVVFPHGIPKKVPRNVCRCPVLDVGDFCPVHGG